MNPTRGRWTTASGPGSGGTSAPERIARRGALAAAAIVSAERRELWAWMLGGVFVLALTELALARRWRATRAAQAGRKISSAASPDTRSPWRRLWSITRTAGARRVGPAVPALPCAAAGTAGPT